MPRLLREALMHQHGFALLGQVQVQVQALACIHIPVASFHSLPRALIIAPVSVSAAEAAGVSAEARFVWTAALFPCLPIPGR